MSQRTEKITSLQAKLFRMNADGWITYGQVERAAGVYRNWCNNFVSGRASKMTMDDGDIEKISDILKKIHTDIGTLV